MKKIISNDIVTLRSLEATDLDVLYRWENDTRLWTVSNIMAPSPKSYLWQYLQNYDSDIYATRQLRLMIALTATGEPVGTVDLTNFDFSKLPVTPPLEPGKRVMMVLDNSKKGISLTIKSDETSDSLSITLISISFLV